MPVLKQPYNNIVNSKMIIGNGMIAKQLRAIDSDRHLFFCSGVSNSTENQAKNFDREINVLTKYSSTNKVLIYFSSCFACLPEYSNIPYYKHKLQVENIIKKIFKKYIIFRLPQVVGSTNNKFTLTNFIFNNIVYDIQFQVYKNCERNLIDLSDIVLVINTYLHGNFATNTITSIANPENYSPEKIVKTFEKILNKQASYTLNNQYEKNCNITLSSEIKSIYTELSLPFGKNYLQNLLKKYYSEKNCEI
jgi:UDP-2-acetamido-2,6-beta-L-arabino-hexul-4-ose reductase